MIEGHSGCKISVCDGSIKKTTQGTNYPENRLVLQIKKQKFFNSCSINKNIIVPKILREDFDNGYSVFMEYFPFSNIIQYLHRAGKSDLDFLFKNICKFIDFCLSKCSYTKLDPEIIISKFDSIAKPHPFSLRNKLRTYLNEEVIIPTGLCHGDLTLSNILLKQDLYQIVLIDFLDSFVESPIVDIAKIRQDTKHGWSSFIYTEKHDKIKTKLSLQYLDEKLVNYFSNFEFFKHYKLFQFMNLLRILPYARQEKKYNFILEQLCSL